MNRKICLGTGILALAILSGCSTNAANNDTASTDGTLTIKGAASAALETVTVADAADSAIATSSTDSAGSYSVDINGDKATFPLTITIIHDGDTLVTVVPAPDSAQLREIEANLSDLTTIAAHKAKIDPNFHKLNHEEWKAKIDSSTDEYMEKAKEYEHHQFVANAALCADSVISAKMDELKAKEDSLRAAQEALEAQLKAGTIDQEAFIKALDSLFGSINRDGMKVGQECEIHAGMPEMDSLEMDSVEMPKFDHPAWSTCADSVVAALQANKDTLEAQYEAGTLTEDAFLAAIRAAKPDCAKPESWGPAPIPPVAPVAPVAPAPESSSSSSAQ